MLLESKFGENICYNLLHYHVSYADRVTGDNELSQAAWGEVLKSYADKPEHARKVATNIVVGMVAAEDVESY